MRSRSKFSALVLFLAVVSAIPALAAEKWKGTPPTQRFNFGGLMGMGIIDSTTGFAVRGTAAVRLLQRGFVGDDINNQVFLEGHLGPAWLPGATFGQYSAHLRWDFHLDDFWTLYSVGGFGGAFRSDRFIVLPRFGIGAVWDVFAQFGLRAELTADFIGVGVHFAL